MKRYLILILIFFSNTANANNVVYLDIQFLIDNSELGKKYKEEIKSIQNQLLIDLKNKKKLIKEKENELINQKNVLKKDEYNKKLKSLDKLIFDYRTYNSQQSNIINEKKKKFSNEILKILNPILTNYVEINNIKLVIEKKNVVVGVKTLDITNDMLKKLNDETNK